MYKEIVRRFLSFTKRGQILVDFDKKEKKFSLSAPVFSSPEIPESIKKYVAARKNLTFKPHATSFHIQDHQVFLFQKMPFELEGTLRKEISAFFQMSQKCRQMFAELAIEEKYQDSLRSEY